jgi:hypothetical protein
MPKLVKLDTTELIMNIVYFTKGRYTPDEIYEVVEMIRDYAKEDEKAKTQLAVVNLKPQEQH